MGRSLFSKVVEEGRESFLRLFKYVSENPVVAGLTRRAEEWECNGVCHYKNGELGILDIPPLIKAVYKALYG